METSIFLGLFWRWISVIVSGILFVRPLVLRDLKKLVVEDRGFGIMYGFLSIFLGLGTVILHMEKSNSYLTLCLYTIRLLMKIQDSLY